eukprot:UN29560
MTMGDDTESEMFLEKKRKQRDNIIMIPTINNNHKNGIKKNKSNINSNSNHILDMPMKPIVHKTKIDIHELTTPVLDNIRDSIEGLEQMDEEIVLSAFSRIDHHFSSYIFNSSMGRLEYLIYLGACIFGHKGMPISILLSCYILGFGGIIFLTLCSLFTVLTTQIIKHVIKRPRPDITLLSDRIFNLRKKIYKSSI